MSERVVFVNDIVYTDGEEHPRESLKSAIVFSADDWGASRALAWVYGIVVGWDDEDGNDDAMVELAAKFGWDATGVARLRRLHAAFEAFA